MNNSYDNDYVNYMSAEKITLTPTFYGYYFTIPRDIFMKMYDIYHTSQYVNEEVRTEIKRVFMDNGGNSIAASGDKYNKDGLYKTFIDYALNFLSNSSIYAAYALVSGKGIYLTFNGQAPAVMVPSPI